jgi:cytochrome b6-f complex iron-sulfur subunit
MSTDCQHEAGTCFTRRAVLAAGGGIGALTLAACSGGSSGGGDGGESPAAGESLGNVSDVPVGGALAATAGGEGVLITQPTQGEIHVFSDVCTHQGCTVEPADGELDCPCHGSRFDLTTGDPTAGPATEPLPEIQVEVGDDGSITTV